MAQINLGMVLLVLGQQGESVDKLQDATVAFRAALEVATRDQFPLIWATVQNNLGVALQELGTREAGVERLEASVLAFQDALKEHSIDRVSLDWAQAQLNLGASLLLIGQRRGDAASLQQALVAFKAAETVFAGQPDSQHLSQVRAGLRTSAQELARLGETQHQ
jgi:hypothetical protein